MEFSYVNPTHIHFGKGKIASIADSIPSDKKVLVIYGGGSIKKNGVYEQVQQALSAHQWQEFARVEPNPSIETMDKAVALVKEEGIEYILAVGGGSVIDGSKYVAAAALYDGEGWDILEGKHSVSEALPLGVILTLPATGSESNQASVISRLATGEKLAFLSPAIYPAFAVLDPDVMKTLPERQLANGLVDAWVHVCEQYLTFPSGAMVQDGFAEALLKNLRVLAGQFPERDSDHWRENLMWTANQALNGELGSGVPQDWATHGIGHELTALYGVDHARSLAIVQPWLLRNQLPVKKAKLEQMGRNVFGLQDGDDLAEKTIQAMEALYQSLGVATTYGDYEGNKAAEVDKLVAQLEKHGQTKIGENQAITLKESREILEMALV